MTWENAGQLCFDQVPLIAKHLPLDYWGNSSDWQQRVHRLFADEERLKPNIDDTMRCFARRGTLPVLPPGALNFLTICRFMCASDTVNILLAADKVHRLIPDPDGTDEQTVLEWLLVETWNEWRWDSFLKLQALRSLSGDNSFYGLPELPTHSN
jgi:hypothetical protein